MRLFHNSRTVVAPHGAGLTSAVFMEPGSKVVEIQFPGRGTAAFLALAHASGLEHHTLFGTAVPGVHADMTIDPEAVVALL